MFLVKFLWLDTLRLYHRQLGFLLRFPLPRLPCLSADLHILADSSPTVSRIDVLSPTTRLTEFVLCILLWPVGISLSSRRRPTSIRGNGLSLGFRKQHRLGTLLDKRLAG